MESRLIKSNKIDKCINGLLYLLPFFFLDQYGAIIIISAIGFSEFYKFNAQENLNIENNSKSTYKYVSMIAVFYVFGFLLNCSVSFFNFGLKIKEITLIPSYTLLYFIFVPLMYYLLNNKAQLKSLLFMNKHILKITIMMCIPILIISAIEGTCQDTFGVSKSMVFQNMFQAMFTAALVEELFFRGFIYQLLKKVVSINCAQILSAIMFTLYHVTLLKQIFSIENLPIIMNLLSIFLLGVANAKICEKTKSLVPAIVFHALVDGAFKNLLILIRIAMI